VGIVVSVVAVLLVIGAVVYYVVRRRRKNTEVYFEEREVEAANLDEDTAGMNAITDDPMDDGETEIVVEVEVHE